MIILSVHKKITEELIMKGIKLFLLSALAASMLASCGMNNSGTTASPTPHATESSNSGNVSDTNNGTVSEDVKDAGDSAGNAVKDVGDAAGDVVEGVGDAAGDVVEGVGDAVDGNNNDNNNR
jgi:hypothetical protein